MSNSKRVNELSAEVAGGDKGNALRDFKTLAEANGFRMGAGGWIRPAEGSDRAVQGWAKLAALVVDHAITMRTVQELDTLRAETDAAARNAAHNARHEHPVLAGQSCDASVHYTGTEHAGPIDAHRSRTSGLMRVTCRAHVDRARAHGVELYSVDIDFEHGLALAMDGIRTAASAKRAERQRLEDVPDATADRDHAVKSWTFRPTDRETELEALSRKLREVSAARDNALRQCSALDASEVATRNLLDSVRAERDRDASLLNNEIEALEREFRKLTERVERQLRILDHATDRRVAAEMERDELARQLREQEGERESDRESYAKAVARIQGLETTVRGARALADNMTVERDQANRQLTQLRDEKAEVVGELQGLRERYREMMTDHNHWRDRALREEDAGRAAVEQHDELIAKLQAHISQEWEASEGSGESIVLEYVEAITARLRALGGEAALARYPEDVDGAVLPDAALAPVPYREAFLALLDELDTHRPVDR